MELRQLEYFQMTSRLKNITRAAERLRVSQPNVTVAIKKLEKELGIQLFDRSQKQLLLTPEGKVFLARIDVALRNIHDAVLEVNDYKKLQKGSIKIGIPPMIGSYLFPQIFSTFQLQYPDLEIYIQEEGSMSIREQLENDELDFGIVITTGISSTLQTLRISIQQILALLPLRHPLAAHKVLSLRDLKNQPLIMLKEGSYLRHAIFREFGKAKIDPRVILQSNQVETIKGLVASGVGASFLLDIIAQNDPSLAALPLSQPLHVEIGLAWKKDRYISWAAQAFVDFCQKHLSQF